MNSEITYHRAFSDEELHQILTLQKENLPQQLSHSEKKIEGFVTVDHSFEILKSMNDVCAHIIAKHNNKVVAYALCMHPNFANDIDVLKAMFVEMDKVSDDGNYIAMGQICVSKMYRKQGVFRGLYKSMKDELKSQFSRIITEVDAKNTRSLNAHYAVGFSEITAYHSDGHNWVLLSLDIKS